MNRLVFRKNLISLLRSEDLEEIFAALPSLPDKYLLNGLFSCLCHPQEQVRWHAVSCFGVVVPSIGTTNMEAARTVMRRFLWMLNDESGGIGWGVPEAMAEVMFHNSRLADEYLHMLVSYTMDDGPELLQDGNFLELEPLQEGVLWGLCRLAPVYGKKLLDLRLDGNIDVYLVSKNSTVKGLACRLAGLLGLRNYISAISGAGADFSPIRLYEDGAIIECTVAELANAALEKF